MKTFNNRRKIFNSSNPRRNNSSRQNNDDYSFSNNPNNNGFRRSNKSFKDQHSDYLNKAKDAIAQGDEVLEQSYLQYAEHCYRQMELSTNRQVSNPRLNTKQEGEFKADIKVSRKISSKNNDSKSADDFDDLASQLS